MSKKLIAASLFVVSALVFAVLSLSGASDNDSSVKGRVTESYDNGSPYLKLNQMPGVSLDEQREAEALLRETRLAKQQFSDINTVKALGYKQLEPFQVNGYIHYINIGLVKDEYILNPQKPESLMYSVDLFTGEHKLVAIMYMLGPEWVGKPLPTIGGELIPWHAHLDVCISITDEDGVNATMSVGDSEDCTIGSRIDAHPMMHVWVVPHPCGPFADSSAIDSTNRLKGKVACDHSHGG